MLTTKADAQKNGAWDIYIGPRVGMVFNDFTKVDGKMETGILLGLTSEVFFTSRTALGLGLNFTHQGCNDVTYRNTSDVDYDLDYVNTEFTYRYYPVDRFCVYAGFDLVRLVRSRYHTPKGKFSLKNHLHRGTVAFPVGFAANYKNCEVNVAYRYQLTRLARKRFADEALGSARNSAFTLSFIYKIQLF